MAEKQTANDAAGAGHYRHRQIASYRDMALRHAMVRCRLTIAWIAQYIVDPYYRRSFECGTEKGSRMRRAKLFECLARRAGQGRKRQCITLCTGRVIEKSTQGRT